MSETLVIDLEVVSLETAEETSFQITDRCRVFRLVGAEILSEVVTPRMNVNASQSRQ